MKVIFDARRFDGIPVWYLAMSINPELLFWVADFDVTKCSRYYWLGLESGEIQKIYIEITWSTYA